MKPAHKPPFSLSLSLSLSNLPTFSPTAAWKFWYQDRKFYNTCCHGLTSPAIFKLFDMGKRKPWKDAKRQILLDNSLAEEAAAERRRRRLGKKEKQTDKQKQQGPAAVNGGGDEGDGCVVEGMKMGS